EKGASGPVRVKLGDKVVAELPEGAAFRRVTLDRAAVTQGFHDGWELSVETPEGQTASVAVERSTLRPERLGEKTDVDIANAMQRFQAHALPENASLAIHRVLF